MLCLLQFNITYITCIARIENKLEKRKQKKKRELSRDNFVSHATDYFFLKQLRRDAACRFCLFCDLINTLQYAQPSWYFDFAVLASLLHDLFNFKSS